MTLSIARLKEYPIFSELPDDELLLIAARARLVQKSSAQELFHLGDRDADDAFLLKGNVRLMSADGREYVIQANSPRGNVPLTRMRPRQHTAIAQGTVDYFLLPNDVVEEIAQQAGTIEQMGYTVADFSEDDREAMWAAFQRDLASGRVVLRSLPEVAVKVRKLLEDEQVTSQQIAEAINSDPVIAAKIIKAANSPAYWGKVQCETVQGAIFRLGLVTTQKLILCFAMRDLFETTSKQLKHRMTELWSRCVDIAATSFVLAKFTRKFPPEEAMLAGLLSCIGEFAVLQYAVNYPVLFNDHAQLQIWCDTLSAPVGKQLLEKWYFPQEYIEVAGSAKQWYRNVNTQADLADLVLLATLQSFHGKPLALPAIDTVPAFSRLNVGDLTLDKSLVVVEQAKAQLDAARLLLVA